MVLLVGVVVLGGVYFFVWFVVECVVNWMGKCFEEGNVEVVVGFVVFVVGCVEVVVVERRKEGKIFLLFLILILKFLFIFLSIYYM